MRISGFTMVKNADKLYYPIKAVIASILPMVDEFIVALGDNDPDDCTLQEIQSLNDAKVKIIHTKWDLKKYPNGTENAHQTDIAREACTGDWLFYLQADEVIHEKYLSVIKAACAENLDDERVEGFLFNYLHFWGDYDHYHLSHGWYPKEIRIIRNHPDIHSWESAQSFRRIPDFDHKNYRQQENTFKLQVKQIDAWIFHYGWVRPPRLMQNKRKSLNKIHNRKATLDDQYASDEEVFDYGPLRYASRFTETHPKVMQDWIARFDWADQLYENGSAPTNRHKFKHERLKYQIVTFLEQNFNGGKTLFSFKNYVLLKD